MTLLSGEEMRERLRDHLEKIEAEVKLPAPAAQPQPELELRNVEPQDTQTHPGSAF